MFQFFDMIGSILNTLISLFNQSIATLVSFFNLSLSGVYYASTAYTLLPVFLKAFVGAFIGYAIIVNILNKGG